MKRIHNNQFRIARVSVLWKVYVKDENVREWQIINKSEDWMDGFPNNTKKGEINEKYMMISFELYVLKFYGKFTLKMKMQERKVDKMKRRVNGWIFESYRKGENIWKIHDDQFRIRCIKILWKVYVKEENGR